MSVYLVALTEPDANAWKAIEKRYRDSSYRVSDTLAFVVVEGVSTATTVRNAVGIDVSQSAPGGIVVKLSPSLYAGALPATVVDWIKAAVG